MKKKRMIRRMVVLGAWLLLIGGLMTLLVAANRRKVVQRCRAVSIVIRGVGENYYIEKEDILERLKRVAGDPVGQEVANVPLNRLEQDLEKNEWIKDAELYFDSRNELHVTVWERQPIARVFTTAGNSFYLDSSGKRMPLLNKVSARVPVVTGFTAASRLDKRDSALLLQVKSLAAFVYAHPFWNAQIGQIDLTPEGVFELVPTVGNHVIRIGSAEAVGEKLDRLFLFYRQVLSKTGFDKYSVLDVQFDDQVVAVKKGTASAVDSVQLKKNIEELLQKSLLEDAEAEAPVLARPDADTASAQQATLQATPAPLKTNPGPDRNTRTQEPVKAQNNPEPGKQEEPKRQPKAVMKKREDRGR